MGMFNKNMKDHNYVSISDPISCPMWVEKQGIANSVITSDINKLHLKWLLCKCKDVWEQYIHSAQALINWYNSLWKWQMHQRQCRMWTSPHIWRSHRTAQTTVWFWPVVHVWCTPSTWYRSLGQFLETHTCTEQEHKTTTSIVRCKMFYHNDEMHYYTWYDMTWHDIYTISDN